MIIGEDGGAVGLTGTRLSLEILFCGGSGGLGDSISPGCACGDGGAAVVVVVGVGGCIGLDGGVNWDGGCTCDSDSDGIDRGCGSGSVGGLAGGIGSGGDCAVEATDGVPGRLKDRTGT